MALQAKSRYNMKFPRNADGIPTFWFGEETKTVTLVDLAKKVWLRVIAGCDCTVIICWGVTEYGQWWVVIFIWMNHYAQYRGRDALTGLPLDFSGAAACASAPTLAAHNSHGKLLPRRDIFDLDAADNAVVQMRDVNYLLKSDRVSVISHWLRCTKHPCCTILRRLQRLGLAINDDQIEAIAGRTGLMESFVGLLQEKGEGSYEHDAVSSYSPRPATHRPDLLHRRGSTRILKWKN